ncbi:hypothetical protein [Jejuia spongiicola]|uniref:Uncharacterized protein n=1 Tax=Jejuia spongiicola TaxID=2942207 RepID=A0ABT0QDA5_9FLAO|nr:hypothetical protein [Jejuia spongiicola]MCL6294906.1 hypothetical protein [Jejuia spongiicola]
MPRKILLKSYLKQELNNKFVLENFIDNNLSDNDVERALSYLEELNKTTNHQITNIKYSEQGDLYIKAETGLTFIK